MAEKLPSEIARETLKQLALRRLAPTPDNYRSLYDEISGNITPPPFPEGSLRQILRVIPGQTPVQKRLLDQFEAAVAQHDWSALQSTLVGYAKLGAGTSVASIDAASSAPPALSLSAALPATAPAPFVVPAELAEQMARLVEHTLHGLSSDDARVHLLGEQLVQFLRQPEPPASTLQLMLSNFSFRLSFATEDQAAVRAMLLELLHMVFTNIASLSLDDRWLHGQAEALVAATAQPLTLRRLDDVQRRLKDVIFKQTEAKGRMVEAQEQMKEMLATFIERLSTMTQASSGYQDRMEHYAEQIAQASTLEEITPVLKEVVGATRTMALDSRVVRDELVDLRERTALKQAEMTRLQNELDKASAQARHDPLTGSLNRKGLDEVIEREIARARRSETPLCVALLDVDNFKQINDRLGHESGDAALVHLATVVREVLRPQDMLARYGGEEFVVVLPDTALPQGVEAMQRLQRELTTRFFLRNNEKLLITFSAGVAQLSTTETSTEAIRRADQGMYLAKRAGKNRVMPA
ncbi:MAG: diguanylate cyclase [Burkholderiales bacterium RIFCSPLOWO2_12_FULL_65_40]|nr:MAG: diguanylate cyclase [Burkholderiales bacterium RIFCSPLOWO2_12_FULL_65_40]